MLPIIIMIVFILIAANETEFVNWARRSGPLIYRHPYQFPAAIIIIETILSSYSERFVMYFNGDSLASVMFTSMLMGMLFIGAGMIMMTTRHKLAHIMAFVYALGVVYVMIVLLECARKNDGLVTIESFEWSQQINITLQIMMLICWMGPGLHGFIRRTIVIDSRISTAVRSIRRGDG